MRREKKYKKFAKQQILLRNAPIARLLKFKRTKWLKTQLSCKALFSRTAKKVFFKKYHNNLLVSSPLKRYQRLTKFYLEGIVLKRAVNLFFDNKLSTYTYKKLINISKKYVTYDEQFLLTIIKPFFLVEILLWKLGFFTSSYEVIQFMQSGKLKLNNKKLFGSTFVQKYDCISFDSYIKFNLLYIKPSLISFIEVDFYTQQIVILKDFNSLTAFDVSLLIPDSLEINSFLNYIRNK